MLFCFDAIAKYLKASLKKVGRDSVELTFG